MILIELVDNQNTTEYVWIDNTWFIFNRFYFVGLAETYVGPIIAEDMKPYTILQYSNGPGYSLNRQDLTNIDLCKFYDM